MLGIAEAAILIICASLPALGPLLRKAKDRYGSGSGSRVLTNQSAHNNARKDGAGSERKWSGHKGHRLEEQEQNKDSIALSSADNMSLFTPPKRDLHTQFA